MDEVVACDEFAGQIVFKPVAGQAKTYELKGILLFGLYDQGELASCAELVLLLGSWGKTQLGKELFQDFAFYFGHFSKTSFMAVLSLRSRFGLLFVKSIIAYYELKIKVEIEFLVLPGVYFGLLLGFWGPFW